MKDNHNYSSDGLGISGALCCIFIVLKLIGVINWSWWWVLAPIWINIAIGLVVFAIYSVIIVKEMKEWDE